MKLFHLIRHLFIPHESNNQKAKLLHPGSLALLIGLFICYQLILEILPGYGPKILGYAASIPPSEIIRLTNERRLAAGLGALTDNPTLDAAAQAKGADMLNRGYWAHVAPDGTTPWSFFTGFGYKYRYAGENLARDFSNPGAAVEAWMNSPSHRENLLNPKYKEIGVAVVEGSLGGADTTIVVQFFGSQYADSLPAVPVAGAQSKTGQTPRPSASPVAVNVTLSSNPVPSASPLAVNAVKNLLSPFAATKGASMVVIWGLMGVLAVDLVVVSRRKIERVGGRSFAHLSFLGMVLAIIIIAKAGQIL